MALGGAWPVLCCLLSSVLMAKHVPGINLTALPPCRYKWYRAYEALHFPDPMGLRLILERWTLGLYPNGEH